VCHVWLVVRAVEETVIRWLSATALKGLRVEITVHRSDTVSRRWPADLVLIPLDDVIGTLNHRARQTRAKRVAVHRRVLSPGSRLVTPMSPKRCQRPRIARPQRGSNPEAVLRTALSRHSCGGLLDRERRHLDSTEARPTVAAAARKTAANTKSVLRGSAVAFSVIKEMRSAAAIPSSAAANMGE
jgi:hypothetical protein